MRIRTSSFGGVGSFFFLFLFIILDGIIIISNTLPVGVLAQEQQCQKKVKVLLHVQKYSLPLLETTITEEKIKFKNTDDDNNDSTSHRRVEYYIIQSYHFLCSVQDVIFYTGHDVKVNETKTTTAATKTEITMEQPKLSLQRRQQQQQQQHDYCSCAIYKWIDNYAEISTSDSKGTKGSNHSNFVNSTTTNNYDTTFNRHIFTKLSNRLYVFIVDSNDNDVDKSNNFLFCNNNNNNNRHNIINVRCIIDTTTDTKRQQYQHHNNQHHQQEQYDIQWFPTHSMILTQKCTLLQQHSTLLSTKDEEERVREYYNEHDRMDDKRNYYLDSIQMYIKRFLHGLIQPSSSLTNVWSTSIVSLLKRSNQNTNYNKRNESTTFVDDDGNQDSNNHENNNNSNSHDKVDIILNSTVSANGGMHRIIQNYLQINSSNITTTATITDATSLSSLSSLSGTINVSIILLLHIPHNIFINLDDAITPINVINNNNNTRKNKKTTCNATPVPSSSSSSLNDSHEQCTDSSTIYFINDIEWIKSSLTLLSHKTSSSSSSSSSSSQNITQYNSDQDKNSSSDDVIDQEEPSFSQRSKEHVLLLQFNAMGIKKWNPININAVSSWTTIFEFGIKIHTRYPTPIGNKNNYHNRRNNIIHNSNTTSAANTTTSRCCTDTDTVINDDGNFLLVPIVPPQIISAIVEQHLNIVSIVDEHNNYDPTTTQGVIIDRNTTTFHNIQEENEKVKEQTSTLYHHQYYYDHYSIHTNNDDNFNESSSSRLLHLWVASGCENHTFYVILITILIATFGTIRMIYDILQVHG